ncbi:YwiC-like family protein [Nostocoides australiense]|nr:YwiC-like family protein [Tetrasphaera australiensis]
MSTSAPTRPRAPKRRSPGWVPNQHGAWAMLAAPLLVGILASRPAAVLVPLTAFWFAGYFAFFAVGLWLKSRRKARYFPPVRAYAVISAVLGVVTLVLDPGLARWAPLFLLPLGVGLVASATRTERSLVSGLATATGSCLMAVVAYDAGGGTDWSRIWIIAAVLAAYFGGTVVYVKTMIRERDSRAHYLLSVTWHALSTLAMLVVSWPLVAVFALLTARAALFPRRAMTPKTVGLIEIAATIAVALGALAA